MTDSVTSSAAADERINFREPKITLLLSGGLGLLASVILTIDKISLLQDKVNGVEADLSCDINAFVSCSAVIDSSQSEAFGFPNSIIGIIGFTVLLTVGVLLAAGLRLPAFVWIGLQAGVVFGVGFVTWLQVQSIYDIGKLCPWCLAVWAVMIPTFVAVTGANLRRFVSPSRIAWFVDQWAMLIIALWYVVVLANIWFKFGSNLWVGLDGP